MLCECVIIFFSPSTPRCSHLRARAHPVLSFVGRKDTLLQGNECLDVSERLGKEEEGEFPTRMYVRMCICMAHPHYWTHGILSDDEERGKGGVSSRVSLPPPPFLHDARTRSIDRRLCAFALSTSPPPPQSPLGSSISLCILHTLCFLLHIIIHTHYHAGLPHLSHPPLPLCV